MVNKALTLLILLAMILPTHSPAEPYDVTPEDVIYSYEVPEDEYLMLEEVEPAPHSLDAYKANTCRACQVECPGTSYYNSRSIACYTTGLIIGVAVIAGLAAIVVNQSNCAHSH